MIIYCRDCLIDGVPLADTPAHGTIHDGRAICIDHLKVSIGGAIADEIPVPMQLAVAGRAAGRPSRC